MSPVATGVAAGDLLPASLVALLDPVFSDFYSI